jgi:hypothetical protein
MFDFITGHLDVIAFVLVIAKYVTDYTKGRTKTKADDYINAGLSHLPLPDIKTAAEKAAEDLGMKRETVAEKSAYVTRPDGKRDHRK